MAKRAIKLGRIVGSMIYSGACNSHDAISAELAAQKITAHELDIYISTAGNSFHYKKNQWELLMNITGPAGNIVRSYSSIDEMQAAYATDGVRVGGLVLIDTGNVEDEDNAKMFVKGNEKYDYVTDLSGAQGIKGADGKQGVKGESGADGKTPELQLVNGDLIAIFN